MQDRQVHVLGDRLRRLGREGSLFPLILILVFHFMKKLWLCLALLLIMESIVRWLCSYRNFFISFLTVELSGFFSKSRSSVQSVVGGLIDSLSLATQCPKFKMNLFLPIHSNQQTLSSQKRKSTTAQDVILGRAPPLKLSINYLKVLNLIFHASLSLLCLP